MHNCANTNRCPVLKDANGWSTVAAAAAAVRSRGTSSHVYSFALTLLLSTNNRTLIAAIQAHACGRRREIQSNDVVDYGQKGTTMRATAVI